MNLNQDLRVEVVSNHFLITHLETLILGEKNLETDYQPNPHYPVRPQAPVCWKSLAFPVSQDLPLEHWPVRSESLGRPSYLPIWFESKASSVQNPYQPATEGEESYCRVTHRKTCLHDFSTVYKNCMDKHIFSLFKREGAAAAWEHSSACLF